MLMIGPSQQRMCVGIVRIELDCLLQQLLCPLLLFHAQPPQMRQRPHDQVPGLDAVGRLAAHARRLRHQDLRLDRADHAVGDLILKLENVGQLAIVSLGPQMSPVRGVDQLSGHANRIG